MRRVQHAHDIVHTVVEEDIHEKSREDISRIKGAQNATSWTCIYPEEQHKLGTSCEHTEPENVCAYCRRNCSQGSVHMDIDHLYLVAPTGAVKGL